MANDRTLTVFARRRWVDPFGEFTLNNLAKLPADGKGEGFELCLGILRDLPEPRGSVTNLDLESYGLFKAGQAWGQLETGQRRESKAGRRADG